MDLKQLECFVAVAEELNFRRAAERLCMSQSAVSERISTLEYSVGVSLLFRTTRQVSLTQAGVDFLKNISSVLSEIERSVASARQCSATGIKRVRVSGVDEAISMLLPPILKEFRQMWPSVSVQILETSSSNKHAQELSNQHTDIAFCRQPSNDDFVQSDFLYSESVYLVTSLQNPLAEREVLTPEDIVNEKIIGYPKHARPILHDILWSSFQKIGKQPNVVSEVIDKSILMQFAGHNIGVGLVPAWVKEISPGGLKFVPYESGGPQIDLYIAYRNRGNTETVDSFIELAKQKASEFADLVLDGELSS